MTTLASQPVIVGDYEHIVTVDAATRLFIVGDVHGCFDELLLLLAKLGVSVGSDTVILTGDLVAKGPKPLDVIRFVKDTPRVYSVRGNHDQHVIRAIDAVTGSENGNGSSGVSYDEKPHQWVALNTTDAERAFIRNLPFTISVPSQNVRVVHAGLVPGRPLTRQTPFDLMNMRNILSDGSATKSKKEGTPWIDHWTGPETIIFGHDAARALQRHPQGLAFGLDSGCCYGNQLSGMEFATKRIEQVQALKVYKPKDEH